MTTVTMSKITGLFSISHEKDLDGIASAAIVQRYARQKGLLYSVLLTDYNVFGSAFSTVASLKNTLIVVTDLGMDVKSLDTVISSLSAAISAGCRVVWLDHHEWPEKCIRAVLSLKNSPVLKIRDDLCASEIAHRVLMPDDTISETLAALAHDMDFNLRQNKAAVALTDLVNLLRFFTAESKQSSTDALMPVLTTLAEKGLPGIWDEQTGRLKDDLLEKRLQNYRRELLKKMRRALQGHQDANLHGYLVRVVEIPVGVSTTDMANFLSDPANLQLDNGQLAVADLLVTISPGGMLGFRRGRDEILCNEAARLFNGGGHPYAAGGEYGLYDNFEAACNDIMHVLSTNKNWISTSTPSADHKVD